MDSLIYRFIAFFLLFNIISMEYVFIQHNQTFGDLNTAESYQRSTINDRRAKLNDHRKYDNKINQHYHHHQRNNHYDPQDIASYQDNENLEKIDNDDNSNNQYKQDSEGHQYDFGYDVKDKEGALTFRKESGDAKSLKGSYGIRDVDGRLRIVKYVADEKGFRAKVETNEPGTGSEDAANVYFNGYDSEKIPSHDVNHRDKGRHSFKHGHYDKHQPLDEALSGPSEANNQIVNYDYEYNNNNNNNVNYAKLSTYPPLRLTPLASNEAVSQFNNKCRKAGKQGVPVDSYNYNYNNEKNYINTLVPFPSNTNHPNVNQNANIYRKYANNRKYNSRRNDYFSKTLDYGYPYNQHFQRIFHSNFY